MSNEQPVSPIPDLSAESFLAATYYSDSRAHSAPAIAKLMEDYAESKLTALEAAFTAFQDEAQTQVEESEKEIAALEAANRELQEKLDAAVIARDKLYVIWVKEESKGRQLQDANQTLRKERDALKERLYGAEPKYEQIQVDLKSAQEALRQIQYKLQGGYDKVALRIVDAALNAKQTPPAAETPAPAGQSDSPECALCHKTVAVRDGCEWEEGDVCDSCLRTQVSQLQATNEQLSDERERLTDAWSQVTDQRNAAMADLTQAQERKRVWIALLKVCSRYHRHLCNHMMRSDCACSCGKDAADAALKSHTEGQCDPKKS